MSRDLREFIDKVDAIGELRRINGADLEHEVGAISEVAGTSPENPAVLFDQIKGYPPGYRVLANPVRKYTRAAVALGLDPHASPIELVKKWKEKSTQLKPLKPVVVNSGPVEENVESGESVDLLKLPAPLWHEKDGGRYLGTGCIVINADPKKEWVNLGVYRVQVFDQSTLGIFIDPGHHGGIIAQEYWSRGKPCPVAISFGHDPTLWIASTFALPHGESEYAFAGALRGSPVEVIEGRETGLPIPATSEISIEGDFMPPDLENRIEGPFGEWTGYYGSGARPCPVVRVKRLMYRTNPIILGAPPIRGIQVGIPFDSVEIWRALESSGVPNIQGVWNHIGHGLLVVVSLKQSYPGHAKQAALAALGARGGSYHGTFVVVVDEDIDPSNLDEVMWAVTTRCEPSEGIDIIRDCWSSYLDPKIPREKKERGQLTNSRAIINACRPFQLLKEYPEVSAIDRDTRLRIIAKWFPGKKV